jgi:hypothetical protein
MAQGHESQTKSLAVLSAQRTGPIPIYGRIATNLLLSILIRIIAAVQLA